MSKAGVRDDPGYGKNRLGVDTRAQRCKTYVGIVAVARLAAAGQAPGLQPGRQWGRAGRPGNGLNGALRYRVSRIGWGMQSPAGSTQGRPLRQDKSRHGGMWMWLGDAGPGRVDTRSTPTGGQIPARREVEVGADLVSALPVTLICIYAFGSYNPLVPQSLRRLMPGDMSTSSAFAGLYTS